MECINKVAEIKVSYHPKRLAGPKISSPKDVINQLKLFYNLSTISLQEEFLIIYLNRISKIIGVYRHTKGSMNGTLADVRMILGIGLKLGCHSIILSHNHPSGNLKPSTQDIDLTLKIKQAASIMDITLFDHIIVDSSFDFFSFAESGEL
jgi:DNA repair protein RadC